MPIEFHCQFCRRLLRTPDEKAGLQALCPGCGEKIFIPHESEAFDEPKEWQDAPAAGQPPAADNRDWFDRLADLQAKPQDTAASPPADLTDDSGDVSRSAPLAGHGPAPTERASGGPSEWSEMSETLSEQPARTRPCPMCGEEVDVAAPRCPVCGEGLRRELGRRPGERFQPQYAGFWLRFAAAVIDGLILAIPVSAVSAIAALLLMNLRWQWNWLADVPDVGFWSSELVLLALVWPYYVPLESSRFQGTLGKMLLGIIVTDMNGGRLTLSRATGRHFAKAISSYCCLLGYIMAGFDDQKQAWHDSIASCLVIRRPPDWD